MDNLTSKLFKAIDANKRTIQTTPKPARKRYNHSTKSKFEIMKEKLAASEWKPELPSENRAFIPKGWRNSTLRWFSFELKKIGVNKEQTESLIKKAAIEICVPPVGEKYIRRIVYEVFEEEPKSQI